MGIVESSIYVAVDGSTVIVAHKFNDLEAAQKYNLLYEEGLIRVKLGSYLRDDPNACREHFERAIQIFENMGAIRELQSAKRAQA